VARGSGNITVWQSDLISCMGLIEIDGACVSFAANVCLSHFHLRTKNIACEYNINFDSLMKFIDLFARPITNCICSSRLFILNVEHNH